MIYFYFRQILSHFKIHFKKSLVEDNFYSENNLLRLVTHFTFLVTIQTFEKFFSAFKRQINPTVLLSDNLI